LTIVDGYLCQEGQGPSAGDVVKMDVILAGYDPVALDTVVCEITGINPKDVIHLKMSEKKGLGTMDLENIKIIGNSTKEVYRKFKKPKIRPVSAPLPRWLAKYIANVVFRASVKFNPDKCRLCGTCWENCPGNAIIPPEQMKKGNTPTWIKKNCIMCYCCVELCPYEAVNFKINYVKNVLMSWAGAALISVIAILIVIFILIFAV
jgi:NAD-dependent dihydropyrimidine dehydrogenase PreA subunit